MTSHKIIRISEIMILFLFIPILMFSGDTTETAYSISPKPDNSRSIYSLNVYNTKYYINIDSKSVSVYDGNNLLSVYDPTLNGQNILCSTVCDLDNNGTEELLLLLKSCKVEYDDALVILSYDGSFHEKFNKPLGSLNPWKVQICDVDGDDTVEISIGVYTKSAFHGDWAKRPFIYDYKNNDLQPKWLGSRLSKPFDDYIFCDIDKDGKDELLSIELLESGKKEITAYKWKGFGFEGIGNSKAFDDISGIKPDAKKITALVLEHNDWIHKTFEYQEDKLID